MNVTIDHRRKCQNESQPATLPPTGAKATMATSVASAGGMLQREEESEAHVRKEDQENINKFARLNARLHELRDERDALKVEMLWNCARAFHIPYVLTSPSLKIEITGTNGRCID